MLRLLLTNILVILVLITAGPVYAFWVWTPETNKWVNPKYSVKETPKEQLDYSLEFYEVGEYKETIKELRKLLKHYPRAREAPDAQHYIGKCFEQLDNPMEAFRQYQLVIDKYPFSERSAEIVKLQYDIGMQILEGDAAKEGIINIIAGPNYNIIEVFRQVIKNAPYGDLAPPAQYKIGLYLLENRLYQEARDEFEILLNDYPDSEWTKPARFQIATADAKRSTDAQYDQRITQAAVDEFEEFVENYPEAELSSQAKSQIQNLREKEAENNFVVAQFYEKQKNFKAAKLYYQIVVDEYTTSKWTARALKKIREMSTKEQ